MGLTYRLIAGYEHFCDTDKKKCKVFAQSHIGRPGFRIVFWWSRFLCPGKLHDECVSYLFLLSLITSAVETPI